MADAVGNTTYSYAANSTFPAAENGPFANDTVTYTWDAAGRRLTTSVDSATVATYTYDTHGRMATVQGSTGVSPVTFSYSYSDASPQFTGLTMPGNLTVTRTFDTHGRLASVSNQRNTGVPPVVFSSFAYTYDASDRRTQVDLVDGGRWEYSYDAAGQLTGGTRYGPKLDQQEGTLVQCAYQYDPMGNPTQRGEDSGVSTYTFNNLNQLVTGGWAGNLSVFGWTSTANLSSLTVDNQAATVFQKGEWTAKGFALAAGNHTFDIVRTATDQTAATAQTSVTRPADGITFSHDLNGNLLGDGNWSYTWNDENRLVAAERPGTAGILPASRLEFVYDGLGRRRIKQEFTRQDNQWVLASETHYTWDGWLPIRETETANSVSRTRTYLHGLDLSGQLAGEGTDAMQTAGGIGGILACASSSSMACFLYDGNGNVVDLAEPLTHSVVAHYEYDPFGKTLVQSGPLADANRVRFSTKEQDGTGLYYYGYRYYSPGLGRWASRDPIGETSGPNVYGFVGADPVSRQDLLGTAEVEYDWGAPLKDHPWYLIDDPARPGGGNSLILHSVECTCKECGAASCSLRVKCLITVTHEIQVNAAKIAVPDRAGVYGHEQKHIANDRQAATAKAGAQLSKIAKGCWNEAQCEAARANAQTVGQQLLDNALNAERSGGYDPYQPGHYYEPKGPVVGKDYPPVDNGPLPPPAGPPSP